ncbi:MAG: hypothetical protein ACYSTT_07850 [Planctomycetota bacterium]|jgi:hypothetical protein
MKPITKQLIIAALILVSVTILSFGIRRVRFSIHRAHIVEHASSARPSDTEDDTKPEQQLDAMAETEYYWEDLYMADTEPDPQDTEESFWDEQAPAEEYTEAKTDSVKKDKGFKKDKLFKGDYAKVKDSKSLNTISLSDHENLYRTKDGEYWYVSKEPGGDVTKMQVKIDDTIGEIIVIGGGEYAKQEHQIIPIGDNENIFLTEEGEAWYVSEQPDGETVKTQVPID